MNRRNNTGIFYGYILVVAGIIAAVFLVGTYSSFGIYFKPVSSELGWTRAVTSIAMSISALLTGLSGIVAGRLIDRYGPKVVIVASGLLVGVGGILMSRVSSLWQLYIFWGIIVGAGMCSTEIPIVATISRWFVKKRGTMTGVTKVGAGLGIMLGPLLTAWLIDGHGWRNAYMATGIVTIVGTVAAGLFFKRDPAEIGELPYGATAASEAADSNIRPLSLRQVFRTREFRLFSLSWLCLGYCIQTVFVHLANHMTDLGISTAVAATALSIVGAFSILGRLGLAAFSDVIGTKRAYVMAFSLLAAGFVWVQFATESWMFMLFAALYGTAHGASYALLSPMTAGLFGLGSLGSILGVILFMGTIGGLVSPVLAGQIFDTTSSYRLAFVLCLAMSAAGLVLITLIKPAVRKVRSAAREKEVIQ